MFFERGLHATSICGALGAAVAVAMLQGQDEAGIASAVGTAASMGACRSANRTGGTVKRVHCGWAAHCGMAAADLDRHGLPARRPCWRAASGFCRRCAATAPTRTPLSAAWARTGSCRAWSSSRTRRNRFTHAGVDAALRLRAQGLAPPTSQRSSWASPSPSCARSPSHPRPSHGRASGYHAAFSGPYTVAAALLGGGLGVVPTSDFDRRRRR